MTSVVGQIQVSFILSPSLDVLRTALCRAFGLDQFVGCSYFTKITRNIGSLTGGRLLRGDAQEELSFGLGIGRRLVVAYNIGYSIAVPASVNDANLTVSRVIQRAIALADSSSSSYLSFSTSPGVRMSAAIVTLIAPRAYPDQIATDANGVPIIGDSATATSSASSGDMANYTIYMVLGIGSLLGFILTAWVCCYIRNVRNKASV